MTNASAELDPPVDPRTGLEAWKYTGNGKLMLRKYTGKLGAGDVAYETVRGGSTFHLSPAERHLNSDMIRDKARDPFHNGTCVLIRPTDETPAAELAEFQSNPAMLTDEQIVALFTPAKKGGEDPLFAHLEQITNPVVLSRIAELADKADLPRSKTDAIKARIESVDPSVAGEAKLIPVTNEVDMPEIYGDLGPAGGNKQTAGEV